MNSPSRICVVGSANIDLTFRTARLPRLGETLAGRDFALGFGGKGANQAVMAARLGAQVSLVGKVGLDSFGDQLLLHLRQQGVDTTHLLRDPQRSSGVAGILVDDSANNCILVVPGANGELSPGDVQAARSAIEEADGLLCQLEVPLETVAAALRLAKQRGVRTILNPAPAIPLPDDLLAQVDLCIPNETEIEQLMGRSARSQEEAESAGRLLLQRGCGAVIVTLGERGVVLVQREATRHIPTLAVSAVDPTGAGDAFVGSLAVFLAEGQPLDSAIHRACVAAALSVTRPGAQASFPTRVEVEDALQNVAGLQEANE